MNDCTLQEPFSWNQLYHYLCMPSFIRTGIFHTTISFISFLFIRSFKNNYRMKQKFKKKYLWRRLIEVERENITGELRNIVVLIQHLKYIHIYSLYQLYIYIAYIYIYVYIWIAPPLFKYQKRFRFIYLCMFVPNRGGEYSVSYPSPSCWNLY